MSTHKDKHPTYREGCFGCKAASLQWGTVPGAYRQTREGSTYYDRQSLRDSLLMTKEEGMDHRSDALKDIENAPIKEMKFDSTGRLTET